MGIVMRKTPGTPYSKVKASFREMNKKRGIQKKEVPFRSKRKRGK